MRNLARSGSNGPVSPSLEPLTPRPDALHQVAGADQFAGSSHEGAPDSMVDPAVEPPHCGALPSAALLLGHRAPPARYPQMPPTYPVDAHITARAATPVSGVCCAAIARLRLLGWHMGASGRGSKREMNRDIAAV
jgi:hypothetical protein